MRPALILPGASSVTPRTAAFESRVRETLARLPGNDQRVACCLGFCGVEPVEWLAARFAGVIVLADPRKFDARPGPGALSANVELRRGGLDAAPRGERPAHVFVAFEPLTPQTPRELDRVLETAHAALDEGGLLVFGLPAAARIGGPLELRLDGAREPRAFHEVELQYRLRRAGFGGLWIDRIAADAPGRDLLSCSATRRIGN